MYKWLRQCQLELRLLLGNPLFLLLPLILGLLFLLYMDQLPFSQYQGVFRQLYERYAIAHTLSLGVVMLLGILMIRRDVRKPSFEWNRSLPVSFSLMLSAKYAVGQLYLLLYTLPANAVLYYVSRTQGVAADIAGRYFLHFMIQSEISYLVTLALSMLLAVWVGNRVVYLIGFCAWMFGTFFMDIFLIGQNGLEFLSTFHLNQFFLNSMNMSSEVWGIALYRKELNASWLFVLAFTLLLLSFSLLLLNRKRPTRYLAGWALLTVASILLATSAFRPFLALWQERYEVYEQLLADPTLLSASNPDNYKPDFHPEYEITKYDIHLQRQQDDSLQLTAVLSIPPSSGESRQVFPLTLHRSFQVVDVSIENRKAEYYRQGDHLDILLPEGGSGKLQATVSYTGKPRDYVQQPPYNRSLFSVGCEVNLPSNAAWYPLPGDQPIYFKNGLNSVDYNQAIVYRPLILPPAQMSLTLEGYACPVYASILETERKPGYQRFEGEETRGVELYGSRDLLELPSDKVPVTIITTPYDRFYAEGLLQYLETRYAYFETWVKDLRTRRVQIIYTDHPFYVGGDLKGDLIISAKYYYQYDIESLPGEWMNTILFGNQAGLREEGLEQEQDVRHLISSLFWYLYYKEEKGLSDAELKHSYGWARSVQTLLHEGDESTDPNRLGNKLAAQAAKAIQDGRTEQLKSLLNEFYRSGLRLPGREEAYYQPEAPVSYKQWNEKWDEMMSVHERGEELD
ncbi:ABC transporter permease [Paenibacillus sp. JSM ZJ436]|uniref:ABC transporter permease n=1 Tax=Paenibacillus sp. JSM ZJ436 TaxID=3376190 RepID=UPI0037A0630E